MNIAHSICERLNILYLEDRYFWIVDRIADDGTTITLSVTPDRVATFDDLPDHPNAVKISHLREMGQQNHGRGNNKILVSSGSILEFENRYLVTKRSEDASIDPGLWTTPAGRCDYTPATTAIRESIEEIELTSQKEEEAMFHYPYLFANQLVGSKKTIKYFEAEEKALGKSRLVRTILDGECIEEAEMWAWYDRSCNTLELRLLLSSNIIDHTSACNPEYHTQTGFYDRDDLFPDQCTPALRQFLFGTQ